MAKAAQWEQMPNEPDMWYDRFDVYRQLGPIRSVEKAYQMVKELSEGKLSGKHVNPQWLEISKEWNWADRARAWDQSLRSQLAEQERELAIDLRLSRLQMIHQLQMKTFAALMSANIEDMDQDKARAYFPQLRMLIVSLFGAERAEFSGEVLTDEGNSSDLSGDIAAQISKVWSQIAEDGKPSAG